MEPRRRWTGGGGGSFTPATLGGDGRAGEHQWEVGKLSEGLIWVVKGRVRVLHGAGRPAEMAVRRGSAPARMGHCVASRRSNGAAKIRGRPCGRAPGLVER